MKDSTFAIRKFITTCYNKSPDNFCWYNLPKLLCNEDLKKLEIYFQEHNYKFMLIINGCNELRPQRTWGTIPVFLKGTDGCRIIHYCTNTFVFCSWMNAYEGYEKDIEELINYIPKNMKCIVFTKN